MVQGIERSLIIRGKARDVTVRDLPNEIAGLNFLHQIKFKQTVEGSHSLCKV